MKNTIKIPASQLTAKHTIWQSDATGIGGIAYRVKAIAKQSGGYAVAIRSGNVNQELIIPYGEMVEVLKQ